MKCAFIQVFVFILFLFLIASCSNSEIEISSNTLLFTKISSQQSNIQFSNNLYFTEDYNPYTFKNFFNGGGVAIGDINNDGLPDIYFSGNLVSNKLYLNKGNFQFEDITASSGLLCENVWSTGVSFVDINHDGFLDVYVCKSGRPDVEGVRHNELFINNGDLTFTEKSAEYGLDFNGLSTQAAFFDYDKDGDLDCYLLNNSIRSVGVYDIVSGLRERYDNDGGNRLLRNEVLADGKIKFVDVSKEAGIYGSAIGFGLGVSVSDLNFDGWEDIYVSNDFFEKDYLYLNNQDGTFTESIDDCMQEISMGAMGADIADISGDGLPDIFVTEMLPATLERFKSKAVFEKIEKTNINYNKGYHRQCGRNTLNIHQGLDEKGMPLFSEVGRMSGVEATEWSWGALANDFDNDGLNDIFIANGIYKDLLDLDYVNFFNPSTIKSMIDKKQDVVTSMMAKIPSQAVRNHLFLNQGDLKFKDVASTEGLDELSFSNGSAYADLDLDGDLDLVINNVDQEASIYRNNCENSNYLQVVLNYQGGNLKGIGSKITLFQGAKKQIRELFPFKGFQSSSDYTIHFGLGKTERIDSVQIIWPNMEISRMKNVKSNQSITVDYKNEIKLAFYAEKASLKNSFFEKLDIAIGKHEENSFSDFTNERLLVMSKSNTGPKISIGDFSNDGLSDIIMTSSTGYKPFFFSQNKNGTFKSQKLENKKLEEGENQDILCFDYDQDGKKDVLIFNGGNEVSEMSSGMKHVFLNHKKGTLNEDESYFRTSFTNSSCACNIDVNGDGLMDVFVGGNSQAKAFGIPFPSKLYLNSPSGFKEFSTSGFDKLGLVTDCQVTDFNGDKKPDLMISTEWGSLKILLNQGNNQFIDASEKWKLSEINGLWSTIELADIDNDGDMDIIAGNIGLNNGLINKSDNSIELWVNDYDSNGQVEAIVTTIKGDNKVPLHLRDDLLAQLPHLKKKFLGYEAYSVAAMEDMFSKEILDRSIVYAINEFQSGIFVNQGQDFSFVPFPQESQMSFIKAILPIDINNDGFIDIITGGNQYAIKPEFGLQAGSYGMILLNNKNEDYISLSLQESGIIEKGEIRDIKSILINNQTHIAIAKNNDFISLYKLKIK